MKFTDVIDAALDRFHRARIHKIGSGLRSLWWPADPGVGALATKRVLVTGATSGIGEAMAKSFAELGATVYLLGRNAEKVKHSAGRIRGEVPGATGFEETCDVSDLDAVRDAEGARRHGRRGHGGVVGGHPAPVSTAALLA